VERNRLADIDGYIEGLFGGNDAALTQNLADAAAAGMPEIQVSSNQGRILYLLARMAKPARILEIGTLGGYSTTWLARALAADGHLVTLELSPTHAAVAERNLERAGIRDKVEIRVGPAADALRHMIARGETPFDFVFIDADKVSYSTYLDLALQLSVSGTVIVADNVIREGAVMDASPADENARAARAFNATVAAHPRLESIIVPIVRTSIDGMSISIVK
jgi:predicted O-methyltransferase YrrM